MPRTDQPRPTIALAMGDPCGISPELTARLAADDETRAAAQLVVIGDKRLFDVGCAHAGVSAAPALVSDAQAARRSDADLVFWDLVNLDPGTVTLGEIAPQGGAAALQNFETALTFAGDGGAGAVCFTPFNKGAMKLADPSYEDEIGFVARVISFHGAASEFNILDGLWNARVTSHIPLSEVASAITGDAIVENLKLTRDALMRSGVGEPRIGVAALNPHAGDNGNFGNEEIEVIAPAVARARREDILCDGPYPSDTVFVRARAGQFDAVLTMYHDQGQIAMKLMGFEKGVTLLGGFPMPICTPAHGTAYDIAGQGRANIGASRNAVLLAAKMAMLA